MERTQSGFAGLANFEAGNRTLRNTKPMMIGEDVRYVQLRVGAAPDGVFGPKTEAAVKSFQQSHGLNATGIVDSITWSELKKINLPEVTGNSSSVIGDWIWWAAGGVVAVGAGLLAASKKKRKK